MKIKDLQKVDKSKVIRGKVMKTCSICSSKIKVILYVDRTYSGGNYFFDIPIVSKEKMANAIKGGTETYRLGNHKLEMLKEDPIPYKHIEYWECDSCFRSSNF